MGKIKPLTQLASDVRLFDLIRVFGNLKENTGYFGGIRIYPARCFCPENPIQIDLCPEIVVIPEKKFISMGAGMRTIELLQYGCSHYEILKRTDPTQPTWLEIYKKHSNLP